MAEISQNQSKIQKFWIYFLNPAQAKKCGIYLPNPTAGLRTYWAQGAQVSQQFAALKTTSKIKTTAKIKDNLKKCS